MKDNHDHAAIARLLLWLAIGAGLAVALKAVWSVSAAGQDGLMPL